MVPGAKSALTGERRVVTAMFCDVVGSTTLAEAMDPEEWADLVGDAIRAMGEVVARFGGTVTEFGGDAVFAIFGAPTAHEDDPYRAVRAGTAIVERIAESSGGPGPAIQVRVGIHTGLVVAGDIEAGALNTFSALGDTLNVAARLQTLAEPGHVVVSGATRRLLGSDVDVRDLGLTPLKGRSAPVHIFEVAHVRETDERSRGVPGLISPMVGRQSDLALLDGLATAARAGTGRVAVVMGEPGVGKSRLLAELHALHAGDPAMVWAVGRCSPFEEELPFHLLSSLVRSLAGVGATESGDVVAKAVRDLAGRCGAHSHTTLLQRLVGVPGEFEELTPEALVVSYQAALLDVLRGLAPPRIVRGAGLRGRALGRSFIGRSRLAGSRGRAHPSAAVGDGDAAGAAGDWLAHVGVRPARSGRVAHRDPAERARRRAVPGTARASAEDRITAAITPLDGRRPRGGESVLPRRGGAIPHRTGTSG